MVINEGGGGGLSRASLIHPLKRIATRVVSDSGCRLLSARTAILRAVPPRQLALSLGKHGRRPRRMAVGEAHLPETECGGQRAISCDNDDACETTPLPDRPPATLASIQSPPLSSVSPSALSFHWARANKRTSENAYRCKRVAAATARRNGTKKSEKRLRAVAAKKNVPNPFRPGTLRTAAAFRGSKRIA